MAGLISLSPMALSFIFPAAVLASKNITITVPNGTTYHQDPDELCLPASWTDIATFFGANYLAHVATVRSRSTESTLEAFLRAAFCLFFPAFGLSAALAMIVSCAAFAPCYIQKATRAGALFMVVRNKEWQPLDEIVHNSILGRPRQHEKNPSTTPAQICVEIFEAWTIFATGLPAPVSVHDLGLKLELPKGYELRTVPRDAAVKPGGDDSVKVELSYNFPKIIVAVVQLLYALSSLYHARINQIRQFGYAAFGLTVTPYAVMSLVNLVSCFFCPDFRGPYLVGSPILEEATKRQEQGSKTVPVVGVLVEYERDRLDISEMNRGGSKDKFTFTSVYTKFEQLYDGGFSATVQNTSPPASQGDANLRNGNSKGPIEQLSTPPAHTYYSVPPEEKNARRCCKLLVPSNIPYEKVNHPLKRLWLRDPNASPPNQKPPKVGNTEDIVKWSPADIITLLLVIGVYGAVIGLVGGISGFRKGESTVAQRVWTMLWLATGLSTVIITHGVRHLAIKVGWGEFAEGLSWAVAAPFIAPAAGGFVVVGQMLRAYGTCTELF